MKTLVQQIDKFSYRNKASFEDKLILFQNIQKLNNELNATLDGPLIKIKELLKNTKYKNILNKKGINTNIENIKKLNKNQQTELLFEYMKATGETIKVKIVDKLQIS